MIAVMNMIYEYYFIHFFIDTWNLAHKLQIAVTYLKHITNPVLFI